VLADIAFRTVKAANHSTIPPSKETAGIIDASLSGVSGDKYLGALLDLGGKTDQLKHVAEIISDVLPGTHKIDVQVSTVERGELSAKLVIVKSDENQKERSGSVIRTGIEKASSKLGLSQWGKMFAIGTIDTLLEAESTVHGHTGHEVILHELGSADTLVDILGTAYLIEQLKLTGINWWSNPIAAGSGTTRFSNREYPVPPPAVAEILRRYNYPMNIGPVQGELSTPTGVAITVNLAPPKSIDHLSIRPEKIGYGAGEKELVDVPNVLRLITGQSLELTHSHDQMVVLETNLDDVTGEIIGRTVERLMASGARDVTVTPVFMKKNRPGHVLSVIASKEDAENLADVLIQETGTFGVRELPVTRHISARASSSIKVEINGKTHEIRVKLSRKSTGKIVGGKLEYEDLRRISNETGLGVREIQKLARPTLEAIYE
jgi:uncharacterized protein (TIGR00299 family) protein